MSLCCVYLFWVLVAAVFIVLYSFRAFGMPSQMGLEAIYLFLVDFLDMFSPGVCSALQSFAW